MSRLLSASILSLVTLAPALAGCGGSAVFVAQSRAGGLMGLEGERVQAMADARRQMSEQCAGAYTIVQEGSAVTGRHRGEPLTEYLVEYACGASPDGGGPHAPGPAGPDAPVKPR